MTQRSHGVNGKNYLVHLANGEKTLCGRVADRVNVTLDATPREELCKSCARKAAAQ